MRRREREQIERKGKDRKRRERLKTNSNFRLKDTKENHDQKEMRCEMKKRDVSTEIGERNVIHESYKRH